MGTIINFSAYAQTSFDYDNINQPNSSSAGKSPWEQKKNRVDIDMKKIQAIKQQKELENIKNQREERSPKSFSEKLSNCRDENKISELPKTVIQKSEEYPERLTEREQSFVTCLAD